MAVHPLHPLHPLPVISASHVLPRKKGLCLKRMTSLDSEKGILLSLVCRGFDGLSRFGAKESGIPREPLWPAVVLIGDGDCVRMSVSHL